MDRQVSRCRLCERPMVDSGKPICSWCIERYLTPIAVRSGTSVENIVELAVLSDKMLADATLKRVHEESQ